MTQSQMRVREAQMQLATGAEVSGSQIPRSTSDLAMEVVVVLSATHHALGGHQKWSTLERLYVAQRVEAKLQRKREERGSDAGAMRKLTTEVSRAELEVH